MSKLSDQELEWVRCWSVVRAVLPVTVLPGILLFYEQWLLFIAALSLTITYAFWTRAMGIVAAILPSAYWYYAALAVIPLISAIVRIKVDSYEKTLLFFTAVSCVAVFVIFYIEVKNRFVSLHGDVFNRENE